MILGFSASDYPVNFNESEPSSAPILYPINSSDSEPSSAPVLYPMNSSDSEPSSAPNLLNVRVHQLVELLHLEI